MIFIDVPRDGGFAAEALTAGARGLVFEDEAPVEVLRAIRMVHLGGVWAPRNAVLAALQGRHYRPAEIGGRPVSVRHLFTIKVRQGR